VKSYIEAFDEINPIDNEIQHLVRKYRKEKDTYAISVIIKEIEETIDDIKEGRI